MRTLQLPDAVWNDLSYCFRTLRQNPVFTPAAVLTLALGIEANTTNFSVVYGVRLKS
jgi:putative ABC transport system permease protein